MTDHAVPPSAAVSADAAQAGSLLRAARQQQGLHIAALAAAIKVTPAKLEALEAGRLQELPDATFARALALTICRVLKTDAAPVLALLPGAPPGSLERVDSGLNTPFRERNGRGDPAQWLPWRHPVLWLAGLLLVAAGAFVLVPSQPGGSLLPSLDGALSPVMPPSAAGLPAQPGLEAVPALPVALAEAASAAPLLGSLAPADLAGPSAGVGAAPGTVAGAPSLSATPGGAAPAAPGASAAGPETPAEPVVLRAVQSTWVQATDANGQVLMARVVPAGETVALNPALPVRLRIGNVAGTELQFRGQPVPLTSPNRDNVANLTLP